MKISDQRSVELGGTDHDHVHSLLGLPQKIMRHQQVPGLAQLVLHELGHDNIFQFKRAVYLADNPDFDHLVGVAGFSGTDCHLHGEDVWGNPVHSSEMMDESAFNKQVRAFLRKSMKARGIDIHNKAEVDSLARDMGMEQPHFLAWDMKHGNHGLLLFEYQDPATLDVVRHKLLVSAVALLGFCPIL